MLVKDLIEKLKNLPNDAEVTISYVCKFSRSEDVEDVAFYERHNIVDLMTKGYKGYKKD